MLLHPALLVSAATAANTTESNTTAEATTTEATTTTTTVPRLRPSVSTNYGDLIFTSPRDVIIRRKGAEPVAFSELQQHLDDIDAVREAK